MTPEITSRSSVASAAGLLFAGTLIIVVDIRINQLDIVADAFGAALILIGILRIQSSIRGAGGTRRVLVGLALIGLVAGIIDTVSVNNLLGSLLATAQIIGAVVLANLLARAFASTETELSATWRLTYRLILWLDAVPILIALTIFIALWGIGLVSADVQISTPLVIPLLMILAIPLIYLLIALWRTRQVSGASAATAI